MKTAIEIFFAIIIIIPLVLCLIYCVKHPREAYLFGRRWEFNEEPEPSECALDFTRYGAIIFLVMLVVIVVLSIITSLN